MNTASRMETTCLRGRIQVSQETADLITAANKGHWLVKREDIVEAKGKGRMQTYWLEMKRSRSSNDTGSTKDMSESGSDRDESCSNTSDWSECHLDSLVSDRNTRLVNWTVEVLRKLLKQVVARREAKGATTLIPHSLKYKQRKGRTVLDEMAEVISLPGFDAKAARKQKDASLIYLGEDVEMQLHAYVTNIAYMYRDNPFHNFEHVAHVIMSVTKLLSRVVAPSSSTLPKNEKPAYKSSKRRNEKDIEDFVFDRA